jgi:hypothetical protein
MKAKKVVPSIREAPTQHTSILSSGITKSITPTVTASPGAKSLQPKTRPPEPSVPKVLPHDSQPSQSIQVSQTVAREPRKGTPVAPIAPVTSKPSLPKPSLPKLVRTNSGSSKPPAPSSNGTKGVRTAPANILANWDAPIMKKKRNLEPRLFTKLSALRGAELSSRNEVAAPVETYTLFDPSNLQIVQQGKPVLMPVKPLAAPPTEDAPEPPIPDRQSSLSTLSDSADMHLYHAESIPLSCPYWAEGRPCPSSPSCFFQHEKMPSAASHALFDQAEQEARKEGYNKFKFGFRVEYQTCIHWRKHGSCTRRSDECWHAHWVLLNQPNKTEKTCYYWAKGRCRLSAEQCRFLHKLTSEVAPDPNNGSRRKSESVITNTHIPILDTQVSEIPAVETTGAETLDRKTPTSQIPDKIQETCFFWAGEGCVLTAEQCKFLHVKTDRMAAMPENYPRRRRSKIQSTCQYWSKGFCRKSAEECGFLHGRTETTPLSNTTGGSQLGSDNYPPSEANPRHEYESYRSDGMNYSNPEPAVNTARKVQIQCHFWAKGYCRRSAEDCSYLHEYPKPQDPQVKAVCRLWSKGQCRKSAVECSFLHEASDKAAFAMPNEIPLFEQNTSVEPLISDNTPNSSNQDWSNVTLDSIATAKSGVKLVDMKCSLNFSGFTTEVMMAVPENINATVAQQTQHSLNLDSWSLAEHLHHYGDLILSEALAAGPVICSTERDELVLFLDFLRDHLAGAVVTLPTFNIVFFPSSESDEWKFLQPGGTSQFNFYIWKSNDLLTPRAVQAGSEDTSHAYISTKISLPRQEFFKQGGKLLKKNVFVLVPDTWSSEKEILTRYFRESEVDLMCSKWQQFLDSSQGLLVIHPDFNLVRIQHIPEFFKILVSTYNVFRFGSDPDSQEFVCERLFENGHGVYVSNEMYQNDPATALKVIDGLLVENSRRPIGGRTWRLLARPGLKDWLLELCKSNGGNGNEET